MSAGTWFALLTVIAVGVLFSYNNIAIFLGLPYAGSMTMFSGLRSAHDNHFLIPAIPIGDLNTYVYVVKLGTQGIDTPEAADFQALVDYAENRRHQLHINVVRWQAHRTCQSAPNTSIRLSLRTEHGQRFDYDNVCDEPDMLRYMAISDYSTCGPWGCSQLRRLSRARTLAERGD